MRKLIAALALLQLALAGCAHDPYRNRVLDDGHGGTKKYFFAYGKFCGPGYPPLKPGYANIADETVAMWPPNDELDAMCYAHDLCYEDGGVTAVCDDALQRLLVENSVKFKGAGCHRLTGDMTLAFFAHCSVNGATERETFANRAVCWTFGVPATALMAMLEAPFMWRKFPTSETTCSTSDDPDLRETVHAFEDRYQKSAINQSHKPIIIPLPDTAVSTK
jgi:hypothetical protein